MAGLLLMLTVGAVDFGRAIWMSNTLAHLAREGARYGVIPSRTSTQIESSISSRAILSDFNSTVCAGRVPPCVEITRGICGDPASPVIVTVRGRFEPISFWVANVWGGGSYGLVARAQMYVEKGVAGVGACP